MCLILSADLALRSSLMFVLAAIEETQNIKYRDIAFTPQHFHVLNLLGCAVVEKMFDSLIQTFALRLHQEGVFEDIQCI
ncbi:MAG: hypothetical protein AB1Z16_06080 [Desulfotignum sp.]